MNFSRGKFTLGCFQKNSKITFIRQWKKTTNLLHTYPYIFRYYPSIYKLKNITQNDFHSGTVKAAKLPKVLKLSKVAKAIDFSNKPKLDQMVKNQTIKETELLQEIAECNGK